MSSNDPAAVIHLAPKDGFKQFAAVKDGALDVPRAALTLRAATDVQVGDNGADAKTAPVKMVARTGQPIEHWFWGRVVHDMAGVTLAKKSLPIDYVHDPGEVLGYLNKFDTSTGDLVVSGALTPFQADDRASEVIFKQKQGVPYEASINFAGDGISYEYIDDGQFTQVNGYRFDGPGIVIRQWPLRGVAVCPYGADANTSTDVEFSQSDTVRVAVFSQAKGTNAMSTTQTPTVEAGKTPAVEAAKALNQQQQATEVPDKGAVELAQQQQQGAKPAEGAPAPVEATQLGGNADAPGKKFLDAFGDQGGVWFAQGKSFEEAQALFVDGLRKTVKEQGEEIASLKSQLSASRGEPASSASNFSPAPGERGATKPAGKTALSGTIRISGRE